MAFRCVAMSTDAAARLRRAASDDFGYPIQRLDLDRTYPCRHCLREASAKTGMLLLSYQAPKPKSVYGHPTAIFMCGLVSRFRSSPEFAACSGANFGIEGH